MEVSLHVSTLELDKTISEHSHWDVHFYKLRIC